MPAKFLVEITRTAERDVEDIWTFIARDNREAADRFVAELDRQMTTLERLPARCPLIAENELMGTRYRHLVSGHYRTIFRVAARRVTP